MNRRTIRYVVSALLSMLLLLAGWGVAPVFADGDLLQAEEAAGDHVYPAQTKGRYTILAAYKGGSKSGQYDKYTVNITGIDTEVNLNTRRGVQVQSVYDGNAGNSLITDISHATTTPKAGLYQNAGSTNYNYLYNNFTLHIPTGYKIAEITYSGQGTRGTLYHLYLKSSNMQLNTTDKTWNAKTSELLAPAHAATGAATDIGVRSMVDIFYNAGVGTTSATYQNAHGSVNQTITVSPITFSLTYDANGGTGAPGTQTMTYDTAAKLSETIPAKTGFLFAGWSIAGVTYNAGQALTVAQVSAFSATQGATVTAKAVWKPITYTVTYDLKGGYGTASGQSVTYGMQFALPAAPVKEGYSFGGWQDSAGNCYKAGESVQASAFCSTDGATVTFSAKWITGQYSVVFYRTKEDTQPQTVVYTIDEAAALPTAPERDGYLFTGWQIDGATYTAGQNVKNLTKTSGGILSAIALWQPVSYSISYDGNGATEGTTANQDNLTYDVSYKLQPNGFQKKYTILYDLQGGTLDHPVQTVEAGFAGWSKSSSKEEAEQEIVFENNAVISNLATRSETVILYAVWDDAPLTITLQTPVKKELSKAAVRDGKAGYLVTGYAFEGWKCADGTFLAKGQQTTVTENLKLTAQWKETTEFVEKLSEEDETGQILNKLDEIGNQLSNGYNLTQEQAEQILAAIEDGSAFKLKIGEVQYTIVRNVDGTLSIKLAAVPEGMDRIVIPSEVKIGEHTYAITEIYKECFRDNKALKEITIGNHITKIGDLAFAGCEKLSKVQIAEGLITIGEKAFDGCRSLTAVSLPQTLQTIGNAAFRDCTSLQKVTLRNGLLTIGNYAFYRCKSLLKIRIPDTVIKAGKYAFARCSGLGSATTSKACMTMGEGIFSDCSSLKKITLKAALTEIPAKAFYNCKKMTSVKMGSKVTQIGRQAFQNCRKLKSVTIPGRVMTIKERAFYQCSSLKKIKISSTHVSSVGKNAFKKCAKGLQFAVPAGKKEAYVKLLRGKY